MHASLFSPVQKCLVLMDIIQLIPVLVGVFIKQHYILAYPIKLAQLDSRVQ